MLWEIGLAADGWLRDGLRYEVLNIEPPAEPPLGWEGAYLEDIRTVADFVRWIDNEFLIHQLVNRPGDPTSDGQLVRNAFRLVLKLGLRGMPLEPAGPFTLQSELAVLRNLRRSCPVAADNAIEADSQSEDVQTAGLAPQAGGAMATVCLPPEQREEIGVGDLTESERLVLEAMLDLGATSKEERKGQQAILKAAGVDKPEPNNYSHVFSHLRSLGLAETKQAGRGGGTWLTQPGVALAQEIAERG